MILQVCFLSLPSIIPTLSLSSSAAAAAAAAVKIEKQYQNKEIMPWLVIKNTYSFFLAKD